jgi:hypothetical protein
MSPIDKSRPDVTQDAYERLSEHASEGAGCYLSGEHTQALATFINQFVDRRDKTIEKMEGLIAKWESSGRVGPPPSMSCLAVKQLLGVVRDSDC